MFQKREGLWVVCSLMENPLIWLYPIFKNEKKNLFLLREKQSVNEGGAEGEGDRM